MERGKCERRNLTPKARVYINVSGELYETSEETLQRYPNTLLGNKTIRERHVCHKSNQYFFNRHRPSFDGILYFYQSRGKLFRPGNIDIDTFIEECEYFLLPEEAIDQLKEAYFGNSGRKISAGTVREIQSNPMLIKVWNVFENAESSDIARVLGTFSVVMLVLSVLTHCMETIPVLQAKTHNSNPAYDIWMIIYLILNTWFFIEFSIRLISSPSKCAFIGSFLTWIEIFSLVPYLFVVVKKICHLSDTLRSLRLLGILRLFRLASNSRRLQSVAVIVRNGLHEFQLFVLVLLIIVVLGGSMIFIIEDSKDDVSFTSIPDSFWWAIQSFLTIGYGDIVPKTPLGKLFSSAYIAFGVLGIAIPTFSFSTKFVHYYRATKHNIL